jgi:hypothetical protein
MHILVDIYVSYAMLNNIFSHFDRITRSTAWGYQQVNSIYDGEIWSS